MGSGLIRVFNNRITYKFDLQNWREQGNTSISGRTLANPVKVRSKWFGKTEWGNGDNPRKESEYLFCCSHRGGSEEFYLLGTKHHLVLWKLADVSGEYMSSIFNMILSACYVLHAGFVRNLLFDREMKAICSSAIFFHSHQTIYLSVCA
jgi:hypothetical protein